MAQLLPFCGWRFDLSQVGALNDVTAPPTCDIDQDLQHTLYRRHPCNVVRLVRSREEPGDTSSTNRVIRADDFLRLWKKEGVLLREHDDCFYVCETIAPPGLSVAANAASHTEAASRITIIACLATPRDSSNDIRRVGAVCEDEVQQELELLRRCRAALTPMSGLLSVNNAGQSKTLSEQLRAAVAGLTPIEMLDDNGIRFRIWPLARPSISSDLYNRLSHAEVMLTGTTAQFTAALLFRDEHESSSNTLFPNDAAGLHLAALVPDDDPGIRFSFPVWELPLLAASTSESIRTLLQADFECQPVGSENFAANDAVELAALNACQPCLALGTPDGAWLIVSHKPNAGKAAESLLIARRRLAENVTQTLQIAAADVRLKAVAVPSMASKKVTTTTDVVILISPASEPDDLLQLADDELSQVLRNQRQLLAPIPTGLVFSIID